MTDGAMPTHPSPTTTNRARRPDRQARKTEQEAIDAGILPDPDEKEFHESGSIRPDLDDQTIAPPG
jgi:hypothetical protein